MVVVGQWLELSVLEGLFPLGTPLVVEGRSLRFGAIVRSVLLSRCEGLLPVRRKVTLLVEVAGLAVLDVVVAEDGEESPHDRVDAVGLILGLCKDLRIRQVLVRILLLHKALREKEESVVEDSLLQRSWYATDQYVEFTDFDGHNTRRFRVVHHLHKVLEIGMHRERVEEPVFDGLLANMVELAVDLERLEPISCFLVTEEGRIPFKQLGSDLKGKVFRNACRGQFSKDGWCCWWRTMRNKGRGCQSGGLWRRNVETVLNRWWWLCCWWDAAGMIVLLVVLLVLLVGIPAASRGGGWSCCWCNGR